ncbi:hypothetical protein KCQ71_20080 [Ruania sp. N2-46]|uniref:Uncharacterized protein n=1 Tax=Occultella gossypii TaxID=2800820 RepID=A0ABS7SGS1_9MICO|nr:hypothetical protein [Occultella gossypii]
MNVELQVAGPETLSAMGQLQEAVKFALSSPSAKLSAPWVTAAKLCARKRPALFPVRDNLVRKYLGLHKFRSYQIEYQLYRRLIGDTDVVEGLAQAMAYAPSIEPGRVRDPVITEPILRVLDVALWTHAKYGNSKPSEVAPVPVDRVDQVGQWRTRQVLQRCPWSDRTDAVRVNLSGGLCNALLELSQQQRWGDGPNAAA